MGVLEVAVLRAVAGGETGTRAGLAPEGAGGAMTRPWFDGQMARLGGLRFPPADLLTHWEALQDMPDGALEAAVTRSQKTRVDFPTPADLRQDADLAYRPAVDDVEDRAVELDEPVTFHRAADGGRR